MLAHYMVMAYLIMAHIVMALQAANNTRTLRMSVAIGGRLENAADVYLAL